MKSLYTLTNSRTQSFFKYLYQYLTITFKSLSLLAIMLTVVQFQDKSQEYFE